MGRSNIPLPETPAGIQALPDLGLGIDGQWAVALILAMGGLILLISLLLATDFGLSLRALGNNPTMARANGIN